MFLKCHSFSIQVLHEAIKFPFSGLAHSTENHTPSTNEKSRQQEKISILGDRQPRLDLLLLIVEDPRLDDIHSIPG